MEFEEWYRRSKYNSWPICEPAPAPIYETAEAAWKAARVGMMPVKALEDVLKKSSPHKLNWTTYTYRELCALVSHYSLKDE